MLLLRRAKTESLFLLFSILAVVVFVAESLRVDLFSFVLGGPVALWLVYRLWRFVAWRDLQRAIHLNQPDIVDPVQISQTHPDRVQLGRGFAWTGADIELLHQYHRVVGEFPHDAGAEGSPIFHGVGQRRESAVELPIDLLSAHMAIEGRTGAGKSVLAANIVRQLIQKTDGAVVLVEPKGDADLIGHTIEAAHQAGRRLAIFCPYFPDLSVMIDPLSTCREANEVQGRLGPVLPESKEGFFSERALLAVQQTAAMQQTLGVRWDLETLLRDTTAYPRRRFLAARYLRAIGVRIDPGTEHQPPEALVIQKAYADSGLSDYVAEKAVSDLITDPQWYASVIDNLNVGLSDLVISRFSPLLTRPGALSWAQIDQDGMVVIVLTASLLLRDLGNKLAKLILQDYMGYIGRRNTTDINPDRHPIYMVIDELPEVIYPDFNDQVNKSGSAGGRFVMMWQSRAGLSARVGRDRAQELVDNVQSRVYLSTADDDTAAKISKSMGTRRITEVGDSRRRTEDHDQTQVRQLGDRRMPLVEPDWLSALPVGHAWARLGGQYRKLKTPLLTPFDARLIEQLGYGNLIETIRRAKEQERQYAEVV